MAPAASSSRRRALSSCSLRPQCGLKLSKLRFNRRLGKESMKKTAETILFSILMMLIFALSAATAYAQSNTSLGYSALSGNTGTENTAVGEFALSNKNSGNRNTASGALSLEDNTSGSDNTATGYGALAGNDTGGSNTATGASALAYNSTG